MPERRQGPLLLVLAHPRYPKHVTALVDENLCLHLYELLETDPTVKLHCQQT
jgi:hypothetical protein